MLACRAFSKSPDKRDQKLLNLGVVTRRFALFSDRLLGGCILPFAPRAALLQISKEILRNRSIDRRFAPCAASRDIFH